MPLSMHQVCVPTLTRALTNLRALLNKGDEYTKAQEMSPAALLDFRLYPNMLPLKWQVYIATDTAKFAITRLTELEAPKFEDNQETFEELGARIDTTIEFLKSVKPEQIDGTEGKEVVMKRKSGDLKFSGEDYLLGYAIPNVLFHVTTAHAILRHNGVEIGKRHFLGGA